MELHLKNISAEEFSQLRVPILFRDKFSDRNFGVITNGKSTFRLAWQSDMLQPEITEIFSNVYAIGIDQNFAIIDFTDGKVLLKLEFTYNFYTVQFVDDKFFVITELELIQIDKYTFKVLKEYPLPDFFQEMQQVDGHLQVKCAGDVNMEI
jgi:hypothetical protein